VANTRSAMKRIKQNDKRRLRNRAARSSIRSAMKSARTAAAEKSAQSKEVVLEAIRVLDRAVGTDQDKKFVLVLKPDSTVDYRPVQLGRLVDGLRVVSSGLKPGEQIVINGLQRVRPGMKVTPKVAEMTADSAALAAR